MSGGVLRLGLLAVAFAVAGAAAAHSPSTAYVHLAEDAEPALTARIALRDVDALLDLDADGDGRLTWGEVADRAADIGRFVAAGMTYSRGGERCRLSAAAPRYLRLDGGGYVEIDFAAACPAGGAARLDYRLFEGIDPSHRVLVTAAGLASPRLLSPGGTLDLAAAPEGFAGFFADGMRHILAGIDHLLFLLALLLPAVLRREDGRWTAAPSPTAAFLSVLWTVTAFTIAHSITLAAASLGWLRIPASIIEPLIAVTVLLAALNNLVPIVQRRLAWIAFGFGLIHGFGFAEVLVPLQLAPGEMARALLAFNLGVEAGQVLVVAVALALLAALRGWNAYPRWVLGGGSCAVALVACGWIAERVFDLPVFG
jgi:hypothetical protein